MGHTNGTVAPGVGSILGRLVEELTVRLQAGEVVDWPAIAQEYPDHAAELSALRPALEMLGQLSRSGDAAVSGLGAAAPDEPLPSILGDFQISHEVGRGGMGVVYDALQISLNRRVALKVLPLAATMDPRQLARFRHEAQAAAMLHHPHIVPVYGVGCERGVHFFAMQLIEGQSLAVIIDELRQGLPSGSNGSLLPSDLSGASGHPAPTAPVAALSTKKSGPGKALYRRVAEVVAQAADALEYAHSMGVVHRDIKPGNLMLDNAGHLWVTDFGLAKFDAAANLTVSGDLLGTLRYMSPEQALAKHGLVDHRTDVYSLGATLYELLTLRPAVSGDDKQEVLRRIAFEEPTPPRKLDRAVPAELETVTLKALAKNPAERYATAGEFADDLRRWLGDRTIRAKPPTLRQRAAKWARRHKAAVWAATAVTVMAAGVAGTAGVWWTAYRSAAEGEARAALQEAIELQHQELWPEAVSAARRARSVLAGASSDPILRQSVDEGIKDLEMVRRLEDARIRAAAFSRDSGIERFDPGAKQSAFEEAFQWYGLDLFSSDPHRVAGYIRGRSIRQQLTAALDEWSGEHPRPAARSTLVAIARAADPDPWRDRLRDAREATDPESLVALAASARGDALAPSTAVLLARLALGTAAAPHALAVLRAAQQKHPADFWVYHELGRYMVEGRPPDLPGAIRYYTAGVALRPQSPGAHLKLATVLEMAGQTGEAVIEYEQVARLAEDCPEGHAGVARLLQATAGPGSDDLGRLIRHARRSVELVPNNGIYLDGLIRALKKGGQLAAAVRAYERAADQEPNVAAHHNALARILADGADPDYRDPARAVRHARIATRLEPRFGTYWYTLGLALRGTGQEAEAIEAFQKAADVDPGDGSRHNALAWLLISTPHRHLRDPRRALTLAERAVKISRTNATHLDTLGVAYFQSGKWADAVDALNRSARLRPNGPYDHSCYILAIAYWHLGATSDARKWYEEGARRTRATPAPDTGRGRYVGEVASEATKVFDTEPVAPMTAPELTPRGAAAPP